MWSVGNVRGSRRPSCWSVRDSWGSSATAWATSRTPARDGWSSCAARPGSADLAAARLLPSSDPGRPGPLGRLAAVHAAAARSLLDIARSSAGSSEPSWIAAPAPRRRHRPHERTGGTGADSAHPGGPALGRRGDARRRAARQPAGAGVPVLLVVTYRDEQVHRSHPLRIVLGELAGGERVRRVELRGLSRASVAALARGATVDPDLLHDRTGGNPFFVTEALAADTDGVPGTVRDAVLARAARLSTRPRDARRRRHRSATSGGLAAGGTAERHARRRGGVPELGHASRRGGRHRVSPRAGTTRDRGVARPRSGGRAAPPCSVQPWPSRGGGARPGAARSSR